MPNIVLTIQQIQPLRVKEEDTYLATLYPEFRTLQYPISKVFPPDYKDVNLKEPTSLLLAYSEREQRFHVTIPEKMQNITQDYGSSVHLKYQEIDDETAENVAFEWTAEVHSRDEVMKLLDGKVENAILVLFESSPPSVVFPRAAGYCQRYCRDCARLPPSQFKRCKARGCC